MMENARPPRFRLRIRTVLFVVAVFALFLVVVIQQVQIGRQQAQIKQTRQRIDRDAVATTKVTTIIRELLA